MARLQRATDRAVLAMIMAVAVSGCRDAGEPFQPAGREPLDARQGARLTYSEGDDRLPAWSANSDTVYYTASLYEGLPAAPGVILAMPRTGTAPARPLLRGAQVDPTALVWLAAPAVAHSQGRVAYARLGLPRAPACGGTRSCPLFEDLPPVPLVTGSVRVRPLAASQGLASDLALPLEFVGHDFVVQVGLPGGGYSVSHYHPFQLEFATDGTLPLRPSWAPDGERLVLSDGMGLLVWSVGAAQAERVPGPDELVTPRWPA